MNALTEDFTAVLFTAGSVADGVCSDILDDLISLCGIKILFQRYCSINSEQVNEIYPELVDRSFFPAIVHNLTMGSCSLTLVSGVNIFHRLRTEKGTFKLLEGGDIFTTGLRHKYPGKTKKELLALGYVGQELEWGLFDFRFHTCDDEASAMALCKLLLNDNDFAELKVGTRHLLRAV